MSTRSNLVRKNSDGTYTVIYCHSDGYPAHNGYMLLRHFHTPEQVDDLFRWGDLSVIRGNVGEEHDFNTCTDRAPQRENRWNTYYMRDRGENTPARTFPTWKSALRYGLAVDGEWVYLYEGGRWYFAPATFYKTKMVRHWEACSTRLNSFVLLTPEHTETRRTRPQTTVFAGLLSPHRKLRYFTSAPLTSRRTHDGGFNINRGYDTVLHVDEVTFREHFWTFGTEDTDWH